MPRFFVNPAQIDTGSVTVTGDDAHHISRSLRMASGEQITVCDGNGTEYQCELTVFLPDRVIAKVLQSVPVQTEPPFSAIVFQALPKGEKLDSVIQKAVECGATEIALFESERCIVRARDEKIAKNERRNRIALEAAKQCGRGKIPQVLPPVSFREALLCASKADLPLFCYEGNGTESLKRVLQRFVSERGSKGTPPVISVMVGSEGGFSPAEAEMARQAGMVPVGLGKRILRTETAAAFVLGCLVYELEMDGLF